MTCLSVSCTIDESRRAWWISLGISLVTHMLVLTVAAAWAISGTFEFGAAGKVPPSPEMEMTYTGPTSAERGATGADPVRNMLQSIPERIHQMQTLSPKEKVAAIKQGKKGFSMVRESSLDEIAALLDIENRAYEPVDPAPDGAFHLDSQITYSMKATASGGCTVVLVDKDGRTLKLVYSAQEMTEDLRAAVEVFKMIDEMPALRKAYIMAIHFFPDEPAKKRGNDD